MNKICSMEECVKLVKPGYTIMVGGFLGVGSPHRIIDALVKAGADNLTLICNDTAMEDVGVGKMVVNKQFKKIITSHIGTNKETGRQLMAGETEIELVPQGTLAERVRAAGAGLGGVLTPTGVGTIVGEGKQVLEIEGKDYLLEMPLHADVAIIFGTKVDKSGNAFHSKTTRNFNPLMAMAADTVIMEAEEIVEVGEIDPHLVMTPATLVDYIVEGGK
ncbi:MAG: 3-oxoacid CoA-transferase subunit A [Clostridia bacterium]|nr:3-oxoacid CoA-transferase subunit A [Clostridia bacterium]